MRQAATPEPVARAMAQLLRPSPDSVVLDPACGIGSILWAAADWARAEGVGLRYEGQDISPPLTDLASAIAHLSGEEFEIRCVDSLTAEADRVDYIACDPPMAARLASPYVMADGSPTTDADVAFIDRALSLLRPRGRAVLLVRRGVLGGGGAARRLREAVLGRARVTAVVGLPPGVLEPFTGLSPALLVLEDAAPTQTLMAELREDWSEQVSPGGGFCVSTYGTWRPNESLGLVWVERESFDPRSLPELAEGAHPASYSGPVQLVSDVAQAIAPSAAPPHRRPRGHPAKHRPVHRTDHTALRVPFRASAARRDQRTSPW